MKFVLKLKSKKIPGVKSITRIPGIDTIIVKGIGKLYQVKYFFDTGKGPRMFAFTSKTPSFITLHSFDAFNIALEPTIGFRFKDDITEAELIEVVSKIVTSTKYTMPKKRRLKENLSEFEPFTVTAGAIAAASAFGIGLATGYATKTEKAKRECKKKFPIQDARQKACIKSYMKNRKAKLVKEEETVTEFLQYIHMIPSELKPLVYFFAVVYGIIFAIPLILQLKNMLVGLYNWSHERYVSGPAEEKVNKELFMGQAKDDPAFAVYDNLRQYINYIIEKQANALIICGPPGMSKTYTTRRTLHFAGKRPGKDYTIEKGASLGLLATYSLLFKYRKRLLILDDFDTPLKDQDIVNLLKSITDTYSKRIVSLPREKVMGTYDKGEKVIGVPEKFEFQGQLIIITNLTKDKIDHALLSRAPAFQVNYNTKQILESTKKMLKYINPAVNMDLKEEVYAYILKLYQKDKTINLTFRAVKSAVDARIGNPLGWKEMVKIIVQYKGGKVAESYLQHLNLL